MYLCLPILPAACCLLPTAYYCLQYSTAYILPTACLLLAYCLLQYSTAYTACCLLMLPGTNIAWNQHHCLEGCPRRV